MSDMVSLLSSFVYVDYLQGTPAHQAHLLGDAWGTLRSYLQLGINILDLVADIIKSV